MVWTQPMQWKNEGVEPSELLTEMGFMGGYKPAAATFNYWMNKNQICIEEMQAAIDNKSDEVHSHEDTYYSKEETDAKISEKVNVADYTFEEILNKVNPAPFSDINHSHDELYYTESEAETLLSEQVDKADYTTEKIIEILGGTSSSGLNAETLDGKYSTDFADVDHNHDEVYCTEAEADTKISESAELLSSFTASLPAGTSNTSVDVSAALTDTSNYIYMLVELDTGAIPVTATFDQANKKVLFSRMSGISVASEITINFKILKIKIY